MKEGEMEQIAALIDRVLAAPEDAAVTEQVKGEVKALASKFPLYPAPSHVGR
jgi:glycine hydroxymethyltransferase